MFVFFATQIDNYFSPRIFNRDRHRTWPSSRSWPSAQALVLLTRNIDLSVGSIVGFTAYFVGTMLAGNPDIAPLLAVLLAVGIGCALGAINGVLVA